MNHTQWKSLLFTLLLSAAAAPSALAQAAMDHSSHGQMPMAQSRSDAQPMTEAEVKKVDLQAQTITLKHGTIKNLNMPAMTMAFKVKTPDLLGKVKAADKVRFTAEMPSGVLTLTAIERVQ